MRRPIRPPSRRECPLRACLIRRNRGAAVPEEHEMAATDNTVSRFWLKLF
jgi:hypothetical protein